MKNKSILIFLFLAFSNQLFAKVTLSALISDNMVLQQQSKVKIWGWSKPDATIKVTASWGVQQSGKADKDGNWLVTINTPVASFTPQTITVSDGEPLTVKNILIGEVWLCSGQSNMEMTLAGMMMTSGVMGANQTIAESNAHPNIRLFNVKQTSSVKPEKDCVGNWNIPSPAVVKSFSAIGYLYALELQKMMNVPIGIICSSWGGTIIEGWMDAESQKQFTDMDLNLVNNEKLPVYNKPISLYNGMIAPIVNFNVRGFLWYQGESNVPRYTTYADKMVAMIKFWRSKWGENLPFFYVEIAPYNYASNRLDLSKEQTKAALLREQQKKVMGMIDNVGMVCTNDLVFPFEENEIHPSNKPEVAKRLAYWAISKVYGGGDAVSVLGSQYKSVKFDGTKAILSFEGAFSTKGEITGFEIAGADSLFYPAVAVKGNMFSPNLTVSSEKVEKPVAVRYCFRNFKLGNVTNAFGQPMVPFRTDNW